MVPTPHSQLEVIYRQLGRSSGFRGFTPGFVLTVAAAAAIATAGIAALAAGRPLSFAALAWTVVGAAIAVLVALTVLAPAIRSRSGVRREAAQATAIQISFPLAVGLATTIAIVVEHPAALEYLPAIWLGLFGLGISALAGLVRERVEYVALFYFAAAAAAYFLRPDTAAGFNLTTGASFTGGHLLAAGVLARSSDPGSGRDPGAGA